MMRREWSGIRRVFRLPFSFRRMRRDVNAELDFHIQGRIDELVSRGIPRAEAEREARRRFGDYSRIESEVERLDLRSNRRRTIVDRLESLGADCRYAARALRRQAIFSCVVIATLTVGMTATTAMYHAVDRTMLHPLPYPDPDRIVYLGWSWARGDDADAISARKFVFWHDESHVFDGLATSRQFQAPLSKNGSTDDGSATVKGMRITADYFHVLRTAPQYGRAFAPGEYVAGGPAVAILGHDLWTTQFGGDESVIGKRMWLEGAPYTIVGIMPASFEVAEASEWTEVLTPLALTEADLEDHGNNYMAIGRLRRGVTSAEADGDMARVFAAFGQAFPDAIERFDRGVKIYSYRSMMVGRDLATVLWLMLGATSFVFLLTCVNVGNLLLARALTRHREFAVRTALGAGRWRLTRQVIVETLLLGGVSALLATPASLFTVRGVVALAHHALMRESQLQLDPRVVLFTSAIALAASVTIGLTVALSATRIDLSRSLAEGGRSASGGRRQRLLRGVLLTTESAIAMVLLAGAGLFIASYARVLSVDPGFDRNGIFTATVAHVPKDYDATSTIWRYEEEVLTRLRATPGIRNAAATASLPLVRGWNLAATVDGHPDKTEGGTEWRAVSPGYFATLGIRLIAGRDFTDGDDGGAPPVVVVSQSFAKTYWKGENPIGQRIYVGRFRNRPLSPAFDEPAREIVGVVADLKDMSLEQKKSRHTVWVPQAQMVGKLAKVPSFAVRANDAGVAATALRRAIQGADPRMRDVDVLAMTDVVSQSMVWRRFQTMLMSAFAAVAVLLTCVGMYGAVSYAVTNRVHEIGVRMALGARPAGVVRLIVSQEMRPVVAGLVVGLVGTLMLSRLIQALLFATSPHDPRTLAAVVVGLAGVAGVAGYVPARRATRVDPLAALRAE